MRLSTSIWEMLYYTQCILCDKEEMIRKKTADLFIFQQPASSILQGKTGYQASKTSQPLANGTLEHCASLISILSGGCFKPPF